MGLLARIGSAFRRPSTAIENFGQVNPDDPIRFLRYLPIPHLPAGLQLTMDEALQIGVVWACVTVIAEAVAASPWTIYGLDIGRGGDRKRKALPDDPLDYLLNSRPNAEMTAIGWREAMLFGALTWGNGYAEIVRDGAGRVAEMWPLLPERMLPRRDPETHQLFYQYAQLDGAMVRLEARDVFHLKGTSITGLVGENRVARAAKAIALSMAAERFALSYFGNNTVLGGIIEMPGKLEPKTFEKIKEDWQEKRAGPHNAHRVVFLESGMKFTPLSNDAEKAQLIETRKWQTEDVARWFRVPLHKLQSAQGSHGYGTNIEQMGIEFTRDALVPWTLKLEQEADYKLVPARGPYRRTKIDLGWLSRGDAKSRAETASIWKKAGIKTTNEIRHEEGMNSVGPEGDILVCETTIQTVEQLLNPAEPASPPDDSTDGSDGSGDATEDDAPDAGDSAQPDAGGAARAAVAALIAGSLDRYGRKIQNREADLRRRGSDEVKLRVNLASLREDERPRLVEECQGGVAILARLAPIVSEIPPEIILAADAVDNGEEPRVAAERLLSRLMTPTATECSP